MRYRTPHQSDRNNISTIPILASVRMQHSQVFDLTYALVPLCETHLEVLMQGIVPLSDEIVEEGKWQDLWTRAQSIVLALAEELDKEGYGIGEELMKEARAEQERKVASTEETKLLLCGRSLSGFTWTHGNSRSLEDAEVSA